MSKKRREAPVRPEGEVAREYEELAGRQYANGKVDHAVETLTKLLSLYPTRFETLHLLANTLVNANRLPEAAEVLTVLKAHLPHRGEVRAMLGSVLARMRMYPVAEQELLEAVEMLPKDVQVRITLAQVYEQWGKDDPSAKYLMEAVHLRSDDLDLVLHAAGVLQHTGRDEESTSLLLHTFPSISVTPEARLLEAMQMPMVSSSVEQIASKRAHLAETLAKLRSEGARIEDPQPNTRATCFQLGYHGLEDRELIQDVALTTLETSPELGYVAANLDRPPVSGRRLSVGFVSSNMRTHSVGRVLNRFLKELDRERFEVVLFELPGKFGGGQETARQWADRTVFIPADLAKARELIEAERMDILMHPDFVLEPFHDMLAYSRLAPVQMSTWGHPGTSGRPSMDYWISCEDWEPPGNERLYTEKLIRLTEPPMIATRLERPEAIASREDLGLPEGRIYGSPQALYKFHPEFDVYLAEVLRHDPQGWVVLIGGIQPRWVDTYMDRFRTRFADVADRLILLRNLPTERFLSLMTHCDVGLDPIHFGGANTSMEAFSMGLPIVTHPGTQVRNRPTYSFYRMMGFCDLIVDSMESYVKLAVRIAKDPSYRGQLSRIIEGSCPAIFDTVKVTRELEAVFESAAREAIGA